MAHSLMVCTVDVHQLAAIVRNRIDNALILDSRSFLEYNASHVINAVNVGCAKLMKRRLQQEKLSIEDFLSQNCHWEVVRSIDIIVYDQNSRDAKCVPPDSFMAVFLQKLLPVYNSVNILKGGFLEFQAAYPNLCEDERTKFAPLTSLSQPCLPVTNHGPTRILPFLYLGSQHDALNQEVLQHYNITYQLNVSTSCPKPDFIQDSHFLRIPVIDNYSEKLLPHFPTAFQFLDKARESGGCVLVHCLAGISRSATIAIAYVMKSLKMTSDEAYRYVKAKRATISPNFNFLGQLLEYEKQLRRECVLELKSELPAAPIFNTSSLLSEQQCKNDCTISRLKEDTALCSATQQIHNNYMFKYADATDAKICKGISHCLQTSDTKETFMAVEQSSSKSQDARSYIRDKQSAALNIKCLPVSSLKELNFTSCQASAFKTAICTESAKNIVKSITKIQNCTSPVKADNVSYSSSFSGYKRNDKKTEMSFTESLLSECRMETVRNSNSLSSDLHSPPDLKTFDFDSKSYNRSDSVSTSGLGSEGSDYADSWNDYTSSCERESDILMDDDYPTVPVDYDEMRRNKVLGYGDSYDDSLTLYPKYPPYNTCHMQQPFNEDYSQAVPREEGEKQRMKCKLSKYAGTTKIDSQDSMANNDYEKALGRAHLLYRAQSCPGMLSSETETALSHTPSLEKILRNSNVKLRNSRPRNSGKDKYWNRYSCSNIDYMDYSVNTGLSHESCPDALHVSVGSDNSTIPSSHCNYRHSMIQVS